jgi:hypothetical protein
MIEQLTMLTPDPVRGARTLERCRRRLAPRPPAQWLERAALAGFCAVYLSALALNAARVLIR